LEGSHLIRFRSDLAELSDRVALVKDTQFNALTGAVVHADFYEVDLEATIRVPVPLHFVGKPAGVIYGGVLQPIRRDIEVECLPMAIPEHIEVDVSPLGIHDAVHVSQLALPEGVSAVYDTDFALVTVVPPSVTETREGGGAAAAEAAPAAGAPAKAAS
ncbi:MAG TPA: 50S ribosomal protein L25, partial [Terriglobales bacterium]|nr:50S ribosomal protein L25 [Terriglobales bacterium]